MMNPLFLQKSNLMSTLQLETIQQYFAEQPIDKAWLFGSYSRGEETPNSDVDILVTFTKGAKVGLLKFSSMILELQDLLKRKVDLVEEGQLLPFAKESAERDKKLIYERKDKR